jgi:hypothetical protein
MPNENNNADGDFTELICARFSYKYRKVRTFMEDEPEREPMRFLHLHGPGVYQGHLGENGVSEQANTSSVFIVNGFVHKCDANFIGQFFYEKLDNFPILIGNYPSDIDEMIQLSSAGVNGVLNVMTQNNMTARSISLEQILEKFD